MFYVAFDGRFKIVRSGKRLASPEMFLKSVRSNMMTKTQDQVMMRAKTRIQASGELKVEYRSSVNVFFDPLEDGDPASPFLASMTMVVVEDRAEDQRQQSDKSPQRRIEGETSHLSQMSHMTTNQLFRCKGLI